MKQSDKQIERKIKTFLNKIHNLQVEIYDYSSFLEDCDNQHMADIIGGAGLELDNVQSILTMKRIGRL